MVDKVLYKVEFVFVITWSMLYHNGFILYLLNCVYLATINCFVHGKSYYKNGRDQLTVVIKIINNIDYT